MPFDALTVRSQENEKIPAARAGTQPTQARGPVAMSLALAGAFRLIPPPEGGLHRDLRSPAVQLSD